MYYIQGKYKFNEFPRREMWVNGDFEGKIYYCTDGYNERVAKLYYRSPKGFRSTRFGLYFIAVFPDGGKKCIYLSDLIGYR